MKQNKDNEPFNTLLDRSVERNLGSRPALNAWSGSDQPSPAASTALQSTVHASALPISQFEKIKSHD